MALDWRGAEVKAHVLAATLAAVNETTHEAAVEAERDHWWVNHTSQLEQETISEPARVVPGGVSGKFGSTRRRGFYGLMLEYKRPWLRPVADRVFPTFAARLRERYNR